MRTRWLRERLDERLAAGTDPRTGSELELRARQICANTERDRLANALEAVLREAHAPARPITVSLPLRRAAVRECAAELEALVGRLRDRKPVDARGAALSERLLADGASPLYYERGLPLCYALRSARLALDPPEPGSRRVPMAA